MVNCSILNCKNRSIKDGVVSFFSFPKDETIAQTWLRYCRPKTNIRTGRVCSVHFLSSDYHKSLRHILMNESPKRCRQIKPDAVPSLHVNAIAQPSSWPKPMDRSSDNVTNYIQPDLPKTDCIEPIELTSNSETSCSVQTQTTQIETCCIETQTIEICSNTVNIPASEYKELMTKIRKYQVVNEKLQQIFTPGQIRSLVSSDKRRIRWSAEDIVAAITLRSVTPKGYRYLRNVIGIPLPGSSTLYKWASKFGIDEGV